MNVKNVVFRKANRKIRPQLISMIQCWLVSRTEGSRTRTKEKDKDLKSEDEDKDLYWSSRILKDNNLGVIIAHAY